VGFAGLANFSLNRESVEEEFARIPQVTANVDDMPEGADTKNRYANVIPLPETRVQLSPREGEPLSEYINANFVHVSILITKSDIY
jgi:protein tyrosine phosphatase